MDEDTDAFNKVMEAYGLPKETDPQKALRAAAVREATKEATLVPLEVMKHCIDGLALAQQVAAQGECQFRQRCRRERADVERRLERAALNVRINLNALNDPDFVGWKQEELQSLRSTSALMLEEVEAIVKKSSGRSSSGKQTGGGGNRRRLAPQTPAAQPGRHKPACHGGGDLFIRKSPFRSHTHQNVNVVPGNGFFQLDVRYFFMEDEARTGRRSRKDLLQSA